jgi:hypothetical protein
MMPSPEYERFSALSGDALESELQGLGLHDYSGDRKAYRARLGRIRELEVEGKGPGAWLERFLYECGKRRPSNEGKNQLHRRPRKR